MRVSTVLVLLNYSDLENSQRQLRAHLLSEAVDRIVCVDNASPGADFELLEEEFGRNEKILLVRAPTNGGYAVGNNLGWRTAVARWPEAEQVIFSNPDVEISEESTAILLEHLVPAGDFDAVSPLIVDGEGRASTLFAWRQPGTLDVLLGASALLTIIRHKLGWRDYVVPILGEPPKQVDVLSGACFAVTVSALVEVGGFDERTFLFCEENILAWKLEGRGLRRAVIPAAPAHHQVSSSISRAVGGSDRKFAIASRSYLTYLEHHLQAPRAVRSIYMGLSALGLLERRLMDFVRTRRSGRRRGL